MHVGDLLQAFLREAEPLLDLLGSDLAQALVQDVADVLEVDGEGQNVRATLGVGLAQPILAADGRQVQLHGVVQVVERVVHRRELGQQLAIVVLQSLEKHAQHRLHDVDHAQHLARCIGRARWWACRARRR